MALVCDCGYRLDISADERERLAATGERLTCPQCGKSRKLRSQIEPACAASSPGPTVTAEGWNGTQANETGIFVATIAPIRRRQISWFAMTMGIGMPIVVAVAILIAVSGTRAPIETGPQKDSAVTAKTAISEREMPPELIEMAVQKPPVLIPFCLTLKGHTDWVESVAFSPDGTRIASASNDQTVKLWDAATGREIATLKGHTDAVKSVAFSSDGIRIASTSVDQTVKLWDAATGREIVTLKGHTRSVNCVAFSPDGTRIASASDDKTVKLWDAATAQEIVTLRGHTEAVTSVAFSPDGTRIASASLDKTVKLWDAATARENVTLKGHTEWVTSVAFSPDGARIASASGDETVKLWDTTTGEETMTLRGHTNWVESVSFSPDGAKIVSSSSDEAVKLWDAATAQEIVTLKGHTHVVNSVAFSSDSKRIASASGDETVKLWDARPEALALVQRQAANVPPEPEPPSVIQRAESVTKRPSAKTHGSGLKTAALLDVMNFNPLANRQYHHRFVHKLRDDDVNIYQDSHSDLLLAVFGPENDLKIVRLMINETSFHGEENGVVTGDGAAALGRCVQRMVGAVDPVLVRDLYQWMNANMARALLTKDGVSTVAGGVGAKFHMTEFGGKRMVCFTILLDPQQPRKTP